MSGSEALTVDGLHVNYQGLTAVDGVSIRVPKGETVALLGANGAGKSSLLRAVAGLVKPAAGFIKLFGQEITSVPAHRLPQQGLVLVPEGRELFPDFTVDMNLRMGAFVKRQQVETTKERVLRQFPALRQKHGDKARFLSGGQQQMLAIARGLMSQPKLLMLDEPSLGLAPRVVKEILTTLIDIRSAGTSTLLVEQNTSVALEVASYLYVLRNGQVVAEGATEEMRHNPAVVKAYLQ